MAATKVLLSHLLVAVLCFIHGAESAVFTIKNNCPYTIWPAALTGAGAPVLTGFELPPNGSKDLAVSSPWSGRVWARTQCSSSSGRFVCQTADCTTGKVECDGHGGAPPASLVEFTLASHERQDFFDVSLVDGFNLPVSIKPSGGNCRTTACPADVNAVCPSVLAVRGDDGKVVGCKSACTALNKDEFCCSGAFATPGTCKPTEYSRLFKGLCPQAYSYAYDDATSTFTCPTGGNYVITFCP